MGFSARTPQQVPTSADAHRHDRPVVAHDSRIKPERADNQRERPAADCSRCPERRAAALIIACNPADERSQRPFPESAFPQVKRSEWSGAGSNCRPSAFQGFHHPWDHDPAASMSALLTRIDAGQQAYSAIVATVPPYAAESRLVCGLRVGTPPKRGLVGYLWGPPGELGG